MQYVNDDMDDLFRRAAENYPLDTSGANWNKVLALMEGESGGKIVSERKQNNNRRFLWLLLMLPLGFVCNQLYSPISLNGNGGQGTVQKGSSGAVKNSTSEGITKDSKTAPGQETAKETEPNRIESRSPIEENDTRTPAPILGRSQKGKASYEAKAAYATKSKRATRNDFAAGGSVRPVMSDVYSVNADATEQSLFGNKIYVPGIAFRSREDRPGMLPGDMKTTPFVEPFSEAPKKMVHVSRPKRFYAGIMGGLDATTIKLQKIENAGFSYGVLGGYQLNKKWSIEAGAFLERKYYYSDGKYFNTSKIYMPANSRISEVSGNCKMIEVPVSARYIFSSRKGSKWFGTLGLSSYFMMEENYTYDYYYGTVGPVTHNKQYSNGSTNLFSNISVSGGYMHPLGNFADLRIEPYFKLPLSGLGIGSLPLFSMGLQVGLTKKF